MSAVAELGTRGWTNLLRLEVPTAHGEAGLGSRLARGETGWECISQGTTRSVRQAACTKQRLVRSRDPTAQANNLSRKRGLVNGDIRRGRVRPVYRRRRLFGGYFPVSRVPWSSRGRRGVGSQRFHLPHCTLASARNAPRADRAVIRARLETEHVDDLSGSSRKLGLPACCSANRSPGCLFL